MSMEDILRGEPDLVCGISDSWDARKSFKVSRAVSKGMEPLRLSLAMTPNSSLLMEQEEINTAAQNRNRQFKCFMIIVN